MTILTGGRSVLILAAGLFLCLAGPSQAVVGTENTATKSETAWTVMLKKHAKRLHHGKIYERPKSGKLALKSLSHKKAITTDIAVHNDSSTIPPSVANANAQLITSDMPIRGVKALYERANDILRAMPNKPADAQLAANIQIVSADQLNDIDRSLRERTPPAHTLEIASAETAATPTEPFVPLTASPNTSSAWEQTALIGKILICFGALVTMTSSVRLFIA